MKIAKMKVENKLVQNVRVNPERALALRNKVIEMERRTGGRFKESEIINFLIDEALERIKLVDNEFKVI